jgi:SSS family solute:Na+ symporter
LLKTSPIDLTIIIVYLLGITLLGVVFSRRQGATSSGFFLAGRSLSWPIIGLALFATNISTVHMVGLASSGYGVGMVIGNFEWLAPFCLILLGLVFAPFYYQSRISTLPEFLEKRFGPGSRTFLAFMAVVGALFIHIGVSLYAGAVIFRTFVDIPIVASILIVSVLTAIYTVAGGLKAVVITESAQTCLLVAGALAVTVFGLIALGNSGIATLSQLREVTKPGQMNMLQPGGEFAWYAMFLGYPVIGVWYWCADQTIVQRVLGARSQRDAQTGPIFAGFIKILTVFLMVFPGVMAYVLFKDQIGANPDSTLAVLITRLTPIGVQGLVAAGLIAALMSTVAGALNSAGTLISIDIVQRLRPATPDKALVFIGRATGCVVMLLAMAWSTQGEHFGGIFAGINQMISCLAPPITVVFLWGVFWKRGTAQAALVTLIGGFLLGAAAFVADFPAFHHEILTKQWGIPFMMQAWWLFCICSVCFFVVSLLTPKPAAEQTRYCWSNPLSTLTGSRFAGLTDSRVLASVLAITMVALYVVFR